ncbi:MAG: M48 family metallopeptidase [Syntrophomonadaceae bacterium]|jgi:predicted metal-dependent hydrolase|nr:M48 family metallopeptidase [Syntrophomonadaceae bacterium]NLF44837.1 M48 family metallopeptidase [Syntrophomonadaceae bacterium]
MIVSNIEIDVIKKDIKNMHLSVLPPMGKVRISAPLNASDDAIRLFAVTKIGWIKKQIEKYENQPRQAEREYVSGESHYIWGRRYILEIRYNNKANNVEIKGSKIFLSVREKSTPKQRERVMNEWYRNELKKRIPVLIDEWEQIIGVKATSWGVRNMKTRWGTCNTKEKRIWINLQLAKKPVYCLEYIIVHELVHLLEKNHTTVFVEYMDKFLPNWRITKEELNSFIMDQYAEE